ncbi:hypothetical protein [Vagococcus carniphilus]|uniref:hypothetical protein n=1 Tax=Vagococcus carniphilus TaxID=218144 RepID=UPI00288D2465|nr:hypothetical protein [Vagococcus carniphilus]MDT2864282.1 hypothetical protein [Vagococcus carniphilus]
MKYRKSQLLNEIEHLHSDYSLEEIEQAISELENSISNNFGVGFRNKATEKAEQDLKHLYLLKDRALEHEKFKMFNQLKKGLEPNVAINLMNNVKDIDDRLFLTCSLLIGYGGHNLFELKEVTA